MRKEQYKLLSKYFSDLSKIWFAATIVKQFAERRFDLVSTIVGVFVSAFLIILAILLPAKGGIKMDWFSITGLVVAAIAGIVTLILKIHQKKTTRQK